MLKTIRYIAEAACLYVLFFLFSLMSAKTASSIGGWIGRNLGSRLAASRKAYRGVEKAIPDLKPDQYKAILDGMWDNLGRIIAEYPHLQTIARNAVEVEGEENLKKVLSGGQGAVFIGAHLANWEILGPTLLEQYGKTLDLTYRAPNNPWSAALLEKVRDPEGQMRAYPKSRSSARLIAKALKEGRYLGILIDQKYNEGVSAPFFGIPAMTNPVFVQLCQKFGCPLVPVQNRRVSGSGFKITVHEPLDIVDDKGEPLPVEVVIERAHALLETWIKEAPEQWLWLHRRWG